MDIPKRWCLSPKVQWAQGATTTFCSILRWPWKQARATVVTRQMGVLSACCWTVPSANFAVRTQSILRHYTSALRLCATALRQLHDIVRYCRCQKTVSLSSSCLLLSYRMCNITAAQAVRLQHRQRCCEASMVPNGVGVSYDTYPKALRKCWGNSLHIAIQKHSVYADKWW